MSAGQSGGYAEWKGKEAPSDDAMEVAVWAYHDMPMDAVRAINTCARKVDALVARKVEEAVERIYSSIESEIDAGAGEFDGGLNLALDIINKVFPRGTPPPTTGG